MYAVTAHPWLRARVVSWWRVSLGPPVMLWWHPGWAHWSVQWGPSSVRASFIGLGGVGGSRGLLGLVWFRGFSRLGGRRVRRP